MDKEKRSGFKNLLVTWRGTSNDCLHPLPVDVQREDSLSTFCVSA